MLSTFPIKSKLVSAATSFSIVVTSMISGCGGERPDPKPSVDFAYNIISKEKFSIPKRIKPDSEGGKNFIYWNRAAQIFKACVAAPEGEKSNPQIFAPYITKLVTYEISNLNKDGVDQRAVDAMERMASFPTRFLESQQDRLISGGIDAGNVGFENGGSAGVGFAIGSAIGYTVVDGVLNILEVNSINNSLEAIRKEFVARYGGSFPPIAITGTGCMNSQNIEKLPSFPLSTRDLER